MTSETPEEGLQRYLRENPPAPRAPPTFSWLDRAVAFVAIVGSIILWGAIGYAILRGIIGWP